MEEVKIIPRTEKNKFWYNICYLVTAAALVHNNRIINWEYPLGWFIYKYSVAAEFLVKDVVQGSTTPYPFLPPNSSVVITVFRFWRLGVPGYHKHIRLVNCWNLLKSNLLLFVLMLLHSVNFVFQGDGYASEHYCYALALFVSLFDTTKKRILK